MRGLESIFALSRRLFRVYVNCGLDNRNTWSDRQNNKQTPSGSKQRPQRRHCTNVLRCSPDMLQCCRFINCSGHEKKWIPGLNFGLSAIMTEVYSDFSQSLQANVGTLLNLETGYERLFQSLCLFTIHERPPSQRRCVTSVVDATL
jgi:hypothetical protein